MFTEARCIVTGKVQAVGYRDFVTSAAKEYGFTGFVQNRKDGSVEIVVQGIPDDLKTFVEALHAGSVLAKVESVGVDWQTPKRQFTDFEVRFES
ncbi:acylphosphatase [Candidatus Parcubacteria bacterium]|uniref:acylphosphatase n=1 Tax=Candidatus Kaiserbacteria bacterium CG10_big_fil_rev_8_21_14_0_10_47_16 TaxID=1974608 RepID=A0A2H0UGE4_9BACT|nr:acylphosphatase [Candidatus Parcubacteria bacterium]PIR84875.1 MAG: acylphosphatase [Candidatus Kaiserbacteria bacterium CG10_big_fil_rev_8_21_14_0_10_47_16]